MAAEYNAVPHAYALIVGDAEQWLAIGIDATSGFMSIWEIEQGSQRIIEPWHTWAHVTSERTQTLWIDVSDNEIRLRINREAYPAVFELPCHVCQIGVWTNSDLIVPQLDIFY